MKDLREQLAERFGRPIPEPEPAQADASASDPLGPTAHLDTEWIRLLRTLGPGVQQTVKANLSLNAARQVTDRTLKALKAAKRGRDRAALTKARSEYLKKREKLAWSRLKEDIGRRSGPQKAYRAIKQSGVDPEQALRKLARLPEDLSSYGANRLRDALS